MKLESLEQQKLVQHLTLLEKQKKIVTFFAVPNGGSRHKLEAINLKKEGVKSGVSDMIIILTDKVLFIEMKQKPKRLKSGKLSVSGISVADSQIAFKDTVNQSNVCEAVICYGYESAMEFVNSYIE